MSAALSSIPARKRQQLAGMLAGFAALFVAIGLVAATNASSAALKIIVVIAFVIGVLLGLLAWGVVASVRHDRGEQRISAALDAALAASGKSLRDLTCGCGHEHDPDELHVVDEDGSPACAHDGAGTDCAHTCETCVVAQLRPLPTATRAERSTTG